MAIIYSAADRSYVDITHMFGDSGRIILVPETPYFSELIVKEDIVGDNPYSNLKRILEGASFDDCLRKADISTRFLEYNDLYQLKAKTKQSHIRKYPLACASRRNNIECAYIAGSDGSDAHIYPNCYNDSFISDKIWAIPCWEVVKSRFEDLLNDGLVYVRNN